jgi:hypothetical protein
MKGFMLVSHLLKSLGSLLHRSNQMGSAIHQPKNKVADLRVGSLEMRTW